MNEYCAKQALVAKLKDSDMDAFFDFELEPDKGSDKGKYIIDFKPTAMVVTTKLQKVDLEDPKEGECLFH